MKATSNTTPSGNRLSGRTVAILSSLTLLAGCVPAGQYEKLGEDYELQGQEIGDLKEEIKQLEKSNRKLLEEKADLGEKLKEIDAMKAKMSEMEALQNQLDDLKKEFADYKQKYRVSVRKKAVETDLGKIVTKSGKSFERATIRGFTETEMLIAHQAGLATLEFPDLPVEYQEKYLYVNPDSEEARLLKDDVAGADPEVEIAVDDATQKTYDDILVQLRKAKLDLQKADAKFNESNQNYTSLDARVDQLRSQIKATEVTINRYRADEQSGIKMSKTDLAKKLAPLQSRYQSLRGALAQATAGRDQAISDRRTIAVQKDTLERTIRSLERRARWLKDRLN